MKIEKKEESDLEKFLGRPVIDDFSENAHRVRRNLLIFSSIALFWKFTGATVGKTQNIFGLGLTGVEDFHIVIGLAIVVFYHLAHFTLFAVEHYRRSHVRLTGAFSKYVVTRWGISKETEKEKTDLYQFIRDKEYENDLFSLFPQYAEQAKNFLEKAKNEEMKDNIPMQGRINDCHAYLGKIEKTLEEFDEKIEPRLARFEKGYKAYKWPEIFRWIIIEYVTPFCIGFISLVLILFF